MNPLSFFSGLVAVCASGYWVLMTLYAYRERTGKGEAGYMWLVTLITAVICLDWGLLNIGIRLW